MPDQGQERLLPEGWRRRLYVVLGALMLISVWPLTRVADWWPLLAIPVIGVIVLIARWSRFFRALAEVIGAILVPWLCLIGFNQLLRWAADVWNAVFGTQPEPSLEFGLWLAVVVFAIASLGYLVAWREKKWATPFVAVILALLNVLGVPLLLAAPRREKPVAVAQTAQSKLDLAILLPAGAPSPLREAAPARGEPDWDVRYSVARQQAIGVDWLLLDSPDPQAALVAARGESAPVPGAPTHRDGADQIVLLNVDGLAPVIPKRLESIPPAAGEIQTWLSAARSAAPVSTVAVLLETTDQKRLRAWEHAVGPTGGSVASIQTLGAHTLTDAALALAAQAPGATEELALALRFRPVLLFDDGETLDAPLDINAFLAGKRVSLCHDDQVKGSRCGVVTRASDLINGPTHLRIRKRQRSDPAAVSAIYVHPTRASQGGRRFVVLDYWWYLDGNPARVAGGTTCGVGLSLPGKTCFDHDSDWEGMTVVLEGSDEDAVPVAVQYAEHSDVVRLDYAQLVADWKEQRARNRAWRSRRFRQNLARIDDLDGRPIAFIAKGTHAAYRHLCPSGCHQVATGLTENGHDGLRSWPSNDTADCIATGCLQLVPTRHRGRDPALWNAYAGVWGERRCILRGSYCDAEISPAAPATQARYQHPLAISGYLDAKWKYHACGGDHPDCPPLPRRGT